MTKRVEVEQYMVRKPVTVKPEMTVFEAAHQILKHRISGVCVVDDNNNLVGVLSELDCLRAIVTKIYQNGEEDAGVVADAMTQQIDCNQPGDDIITVASSMLDHKHRRRPIVVENKLQGQVTCRQILKAIRDFAVPDT